MANDNKGIERIEVEVKVKGGESPSGTIFYIDNPKLSVVTEINVAIAELGKQFALKHK